MKQLVDKAKKLFDMPFQDIIMRVCGEVCAIKDRMPSGAFEKHLTVERLLKFLNADDLNRLHCRLKNTPAIFMSKKLQSGLLERYVPGETNRIVRKAEEIMNGQVCILGSGPVKLGKVNWHRDYKSGLDWPFEYFTDIDVADLDRPSDVKFPWELSRLQWLLPVAQAWILRGDERYAEYVKNVIDDWIQNNPYGWGVNWACTMEPAMRIFIWTWFYRVFSESETWRDLNFRLRFLKGLYLHLLFVKKFIEISKVNGNHLIAEACALVVGGVFFGDGLPIKWMKKAWHILKREIVTQVYKDGVDYEGSVAYHRLVAELFHIAAVAMDKCGGTVPENYKTRLLRMAEFTEAYTRPDGLAPTVGDNDDGRTMPLGGQSVRDHRYVPCLIRNYWDPDQLSERWVESASECLWWWGKAPEKTVAVKPSKSKAFHDGGIYIMRSESDYVFFECSPLGLADQGGHGHNDILSFETVLNGCSLIVDPGCFVYTGDYKARNYYRSTGAHNTPQVAAEEINRFISERNLWFLRCDSKPDIRSWEDNVKFARIVASHDGYMRLEKPVTVIRTLMLDKINHSISWKDDLEPDDAEDLKVPLRLAPTVDVQILPNARVFLKKDDHQFVLDWSASDAWELNSHRSKVAFEYGVETSAMCLIWERHVNKSGGLFVHIQPMLDKQGLHEMPRPESIIMPL